ncbi:MAG: AraC family transcriptional regulator [Lachnospiraceae bacterium]|nr:AraC family transcriptional regulator [Lachnospiraceae bacterium]
MKKSKECEMMPVQPYLVLRTDNYETVLEKNYGIAQFYEFSLETEIQNGMTAVPDGSVDLLFGFDDHNVKTYIGGTVLNAKNWELGSGHRYFGVRFQPGRCILPQELSIADLVNNDLEIDGNLFGRNLSQKLEEAGNIRQRADVFLSAYRNMYQGQTQDGIMELEHYIRERIYVCQGNISIKQLSEETGYSECYIRRVFKQIHGISPKNFERFVRFQNVLTTMNRKAHMLQLDELALECGYYDESHMMKDFKSFVGITPQGYDRLITGTKLCEM